MKKFLLPLLFFLVYGSVYGQKSAAGVNIDIHYARFNFHPLLTDSFLIANVTYYFKVVAASDSIYFDFAGNMNVDSIFFNGNKIQPQEFYQTQDFLVLKTGSLNAGDEDSISVYYHGYPGDYPQQAYFLSVQNTNDTIPVLWTLSEPYGAMTWYPCKQNLSDKIDSIDVYIEHPQGYTAVSNGLMVGQAVSGSNVITHWYHSYPIETYLIAIAVSKYYNYEFTFEDTVYHISYPVENYIYPDMVQDTANIDIVKQFLQFYTDKFGLYPFKNEKYGQVVCEIRGGMEHQTATFLSSIFNFELVSHELAHQWFGDYITCRSWHDIWLNEGFATYLTGLCYENLAPQYWLPWKDLTIRTVFLEDGGSVYCDDTTDIERIFDGRLSYRKGSYLLHMIRWEIGDSAFYAAIRNYLSDSSLAYGYATTDDLKHYFEIAGDTDLTEFFNDWFFGQGYPIYDINWQDSNNVLTITINQGWSYEQRVFDITLPIVIWHGGEDTTILTDMHDYSKTLNIPLPYAVDSVVFDPDLWVLAPHNDVVHNYVDFPTKNNVIVWPVPFADSFYVSASTGSQISVYDEKGRKIAENNFSGSKIIKFDTKDWASGIYAIKVKGQDSEMTVKNVIKVK